MNWFPNVSYLLSFAKEAYRSKKILRLSKTQIKKLQQEKFARLVRFVSEKSPYYQKIIQEHQIDINTATSNDFPVLTKEILLEHFDEIVTDRRLTRKRVEAFLAESKKPTDLFLDTYIVMHSSGSSGTTGYYVYTKEELIKGVAPVTRASGLHLNQKLAYVAAIKGHFAGVTMISLAEKLPLLYQQIKFFDINNPLSDIIEGLNDLQPTVVSGYVFALRKLAEAQEEKKLQIKPVLLQSGGEAIGAKDKKYIQKVFQAPIINTYAATEHLIMGIGKDSYKGMYMMEDNLIFEVHSDFTCVTNLYNYTLPLIRYKMTDRLEPIEDTTRQMPFLKVKEIVGRKEYTPVFLNDSGVEDFLSTSYLIEFYVKNLDRFQIQLIDKKSFIFKACLVKGLNKDQIDTAVKEIKGQLRQILSEKRMTVVKFEIKLVDHLWADPKTGKFRLIIK